MPPPQLPSLPLIHLPFFGGKKNRRRLTISERSTTEDYSSRRSSIDRLASGSATPTSHAENLTFSEIESSGVDAYSDRSARPTLYPSESSSNLAESVLADRIRDEDPIPDRPDTTTRLESLRNLMHSYGLDY